MFHALKTLYSLLTVDGKRSAALLLFLFIPTALVEALSIASILPFIDVMTEYQNTLAKPIISDVYLYFGKPEPRVFFMILGGVVLVLLLTANCLGIASVWAMQLFCRNQNHEFSLRLLNKYLNQPYSYFLTRNRSMTSKNVLMESENMIFNVLQPALDMVAKLAIIVVVLIMLFISDPIPTLFMGLVVGLVYAIIYYGIRNTLNYISIRRVQANGERFKAVSEAFNAIKEVKLRSSESFLVNQFAKPSKVYTSESCKHEIISRTTGYLVEIMAFGGIVAIVLVLIFQERATQQILSQLGLYAFAAYRLMPATQRIYSSLTKIRANTECVNLIHRELEINEDRELQKKDHAPVSSVKPVAKTIVPEIQKSFGLQNIHYAYPSGSDVLFNGLNLNVARGETLGIVGSTGCGKTSLVDIFLGLLSPQQGAITVDGEILESSQIKAWQAKLGYVPQHIYLCDDTIERNIAFAVDDSLIDRDAVKAAARIAQIDRFIEEELPEGYQTGVGDHGVRLSGGQIQRLGIARALYHKPEILFFDEATSALDMRTESAVMDSIFSLQKARTLIIIAHRLNTIKRCSRIIMIDAGKVVAEGSYAELIASSMEFRQLAEHMDEIRV